MVFAVYPCLLNLSGFMGSGWGCFGLRGLGWGYFGMVKEGLF